MEIGVKRNGIFTISFFAAVLSWPTQTNAICRTFYESDGSYTENICEEDTSNEIGIGTTAPGAKLTVQTNASGTAVQLLSGSTGYHTDLSIGRASTEGQLGIASAAGLYSTSAGVGDLVLRLNDSTKKLLLQAGTGTAPLTVTNSNVGIGTTSPAYKLDVNGAGNFTGNLTVDTNVLYVDTANNNVGIGTAPSASYRLHVDGVPFIGGNVTILGDLNMGGAPMVVWEQYHRVGINENSPGAKLEVNGNVYVSTPGNGIVWKHADEARLMVNSNGILGTQCSGCSGDSQLEVALFVVDEFGAAGECSGGYIYYDEDAYEDGFEALNYDQIRVNTDPGVDARDFVDFSGGGQDNNDPYGADFADVFLLATHGSHDCTGGYSEFTMGDDGDCKVRTSEMEFGNGGSNEEAKVGLLVACDSVHQCVWENGGYDDMFHGGFNILNGYHGTSYDNHDNDIGDYIEIAEEGGVGDDWVDLLTCDGGPFNIHDQQCATSMVFGGANYTAAFIYHNEGFKNFYDQGGHTYTDTWFDCGCNPDGGVALYDHKCE